MRTLPSATMPSELSSTDCACSIASLSWLFRRFCVASTLEASTASAAFVIFSALSFMLRASDAMAFADFFSLLMPCDVSHDRIFASFALDMAALSLVTVLASAT